MEPHYQAQTIEEIDATKPAPTPEERQAQQQFAESVPVIEREGNSSSLFTLITRSRH